MRIKVFYMISAIMVLLLPHTLLASDIGSIDTGITCWMLTSTALVLLMIPGLGMFYGGLVRSKNVLGTMMHSFVTISIIGVLWVICGYSLTFGESILAGLVVITPAAGVVQPTGAIILGTLSAVACYYALRIKMKFGYDDSLDCFGIHGVGSGLGVLLLCFFIRKSWMEDAAVAVGGNWTPINQLMIQLAGIGATIALAVIGTVLIYFIVEKTVGFRIDEQGEIEGLDQSLHGENGYGFMNSEFAK